MYKQHYIYLAKYDVNRYLLEVWLYDLWSYKRIIAKAKKEYIFASIQWTHSCKFLQLDLEFLAWFLTARQVTVHLKIYHDWYLIHSVSSPFWLFDGMSNWIRFNSYLSLRHHIFLTFESWFESSLQSFPWIHPINVWGSLVSCSWFPDWFLRFWLGLGLDLAWIKPESPWILKSFFSSNPIHTITAACWFSQSLFRRSCVLS